jgi:hypothetical protein
MGYDKISKECPRCTSTTEVDLLLAASMCHAHKCQLHSNVKASLFLLNSDSPTLPTRCEYTVNSDMYTGGVPYYCIKRPSMALRVPVDQSEFVPCPAAAVIHNYTQLGVRLLSRETQATL